MNARKYGTSFAFHFLIKFSRVTLVNKNIKISGMGFCVTKSVYCTVPTTQSQICHHMVPVFLNPDWHQNQCGEYIVSIWSWEPSSVVSRFKL